MKSKEDKEDVFLTRWDVRKRKNKLVVNLYFCKRKSFEGKLQQGLQKFLGKRNTKSLRIEVSKFLEEFWKKNWWWDRYKYTLVKELEKLNE